MEQANIADIVNNFLRDVQHVKEIERLLKVEGNESAVQERRTAAYQALFKEYFQSLQGTPEAAYLNALLTPSRDGGFVRPISSGVDYNFDKSLDELDFSQRTRNALQHSEIIYVGELVEKTEAQLLRSIFGRKQINEIKELLVDEGLSLGMNLGYVRPEKRK